MQTLKHVQLALCTAAQLPELFISLSNNGRQETKELAEVQEVE